MNKFTYRQSGTNGHEIVDPEGQIVAWTIDAGWAGIIVGLLNQAGLHRPGQEEGTMTQKQIQELVKTLLKHRPDLVIVKTANAQEKMTLVKLLRSAGATVIYRER